MTIERTVCDMCGCEVNKDDSVFIMVKFRGKGDKFDRRRYDYKKDLCAGCAEKLGIKKPEAR